MTVTGASGVTVRRHLPAPSPRAPSMPSSPWAGEGLQVIEKVVVMTKAEQKDNPDLEAAAACQGVRLVFQEQLRELLTDHAKHTVGLGSSG